MFTANSGSAVMARKPVKKTERERFDMRIDPDIRERAERQASRFGESFSAYMRRALIKQVEEDEGTAPPPKPHA